MASEKRMEQVVMEEVRLIFRNFQGEEKPMNKKGDRNFGVILPPDVAQEMADDGWNVKYLKARDEDEGAEPTPWIPVKLGYTGSRPPAVWLITRRGRNALTEAEVGMLDWVDIKNVDLILNPYQWTVQGNTGVKAYAESIFVTINESVLDEKYSDLDQI